MNKASTARVCLVCGSIHSKKNGMDDHGQQRYQCNDYHMSLIESGRT
ncbi:IS1/IS1595 family N-terminal zinc-binding domain-containing protein [Sharpea azabuensis]